MKATPTMQIYSELQQAYNHFNTELFDGQLPPCIIMLYNKERRMYGYYVNEQFVNQKGEKCDAIAMNPQYFAARQIEEVMQTIVHEMCHQWQYHFGSNKSRKAYHNKEWGDKMEAIGLMPSSTGQPGGSKTGQNMGDYQIEGGRFQKSCKKLLTPDFRLSWVDRFAVITDTTPPELVSTLTEIGVVTETPTDKPNRTNRVKYTCPTCQKNVWGKPELNIICGDCEVAYTPLPYSIQEEV